MKSFALSAITLALTVGAAQLAHAEVITQWSFNSITPDGATGTGSALPSVGAGSLSLIGGVTTPSFNSGVGSSDPAASDNSGLQTTTYGAQGSGNATRGIEVKVDASGFEDVVFSYDLRHSNTSSRYELAQYSLDGVNFIDYAVFDSGLGDTWFNARTIDLSSIAGADHNANLAFRVVATFAPGTSGYLASDATKTFAGSGTWRFDMVSVSGTALPVPEPTSAAAALAGLAAIGFLARRRRAA
ncbi:PEP-CTERM sorting domain-containing protein [Aquabacterium sp. UBA2148]|uniref:PEP-CTERM sorting domain-containing protein n=1 Tax=Aquabacterium sp. UBA2148 TaxID=1946042 RepID=UPI00257C5AD6|nr:PEP-CTERM sorting domain-containing protein [Aquabacterium sp. UBA2148]